MLSLIDNRHMKLVLLTIMKEGVGILISCKGAVVCKSLGNYGLYV